MIFDDLNLDPSLKKALEIEKITIPTEIQYKVIPIALENKDIIAIALDPQIETMVNIARVASPDKKIGLVCITEKFAQRVFKSIKYAGIKYKSISFTTTQDSKELNKFINNSDILIASPGRKKKVKKYINDLTPLIEFIYIPDKGSIDTLKNKILDVKRER